MCTRLCLSYARWFSCTLYLCVSVSDEVPYMWATHFLPFVYFLVYNLHWPYWSFLVVKMALNSILSCFYFAKSLFYTLFCMLCAGDSQLNCLETRRRLCMKLKLAITVKLKAWNLLTSGFNFWSQSSLHELVFVLSLNYFKTYPFKVYLDQVNPQKRLLTIVQRGSDDFLNLRVEHKIKLERKFIKACVALMVSTLALLACLVVAGVWDSAVKWK